MLRDLSQDESPKQVANVAHLPGIQRYSLAMPDIHWGYGFPSAGGGLRLEGRSDLSGGVGYDINCGTRLLRSNLSIQDLRPRIKDLAQAFLSPFPRRGLERSPAVKLPGIASGPEEGIGLGGESGIWVFRGSGPDEDQGCMEGADPDVVGDRAMERGRPQLGTLGSGNHFLEVGYVEEFMTQEWPGSSGWRRIR